MFGKRKNNIIFFTLLNISVLTVSLIYNLVFEEKMLEVFRSGCVFFNLYGYYCPGCGGSRSLNALLNFNLIKSFIYYPAIPYAALLILDIDIRLLVSIIRGENKVSGFRLYSFVGIPIIIMLNFFVRNILLRFGIVYLI